MNLDSSSVSIRDTTPLKSLDCEKEEKIDDYLTCKTIFKSKIKFNKFNYK